MAANSVGARSARTAHRAYRRDGGAPAYGLRFHLEATPAPVADMAAAFGDELAAEGVDGDALLAAARRIALAHGARLPDVAPAGGGDRP